MKSTIEDFIKNVVELRWHLTTTTFSYFFSYILVFGINNQSAEAIYPFFRYFHFFPHVLVIHILVFSYGLKSPENSRFTKSLRSIVGSVVLSIIAVLGLFVLTYGLYPALWALVPFGLTNPALLLGVEWWERNQHLGKQNTTTTGLHYLAYLIFLVFFVVKFQLPITRYIQFSWEVIPLEISRYPFVIGSGLLLLGVVLCLPERFHLVSLTILSLLTGLIAHADLLFYQFFGELPSLEQLSLIHQIPQTSASIHEMLKWDQLVLWLDGPLWIGLLWIYITDSASRINGILKWFRLCSIKRIELIILCFFFGITLIFPGLLTLEKLFTSRDHQIAFYGDDLITSNSGLVGYHVYDGLLNVYRKPDVDEKALKQAEQYFKHHKTDFGDESSTAQKNVVLVVAESLQPYVLDLSLDGQEVTPLLNNWSENSVVHSNVFDVTGDGGAKSADAKFAILNSLLPFNNQLVFYEYENNTYRALPQILSEHGYTTTSSSGSRGSIFNSEFIFRRYGIDKRWFVDEWDTPPFNWWGLADHQLMSLTGERLKTVQEPFFSLVISSTGHHPYRVPEGISNFQPGTLSGELFGDYLQAMNYFDRSLSILVNRLKQNNQYRNTIFIIVGDHVATFDHEALKNVLSPPWSNKKYRRFHPRVPLIIFDPTAQQNTEVTGPTSQLDVTPTVLDYLNIPPDHPYMIGNSLLRKEKRLPVVPLPDGRATDGRYFYVPPPKKQCVDLTDLVLRAPKNCVGLVKRSDALREMSKRVIVGDLIQ